MSIQPEPANISSSYLHAAGEVGKTSLRQQLASKSSAARQEVMSALNVVSGNRTSTVTTAPPENQALKKVAAEVLGRHLMAAFASVKKRQRG